VVMYNAGAQGPRAMAITRPSLDSLRRRAVAGFDRFSDEWIGLRFPAVDRALLDADWRADERDQYCTRCGDSIGRGESTASGCGTCRKGGELAGGLGDGVVRLGPYTNPLREWVLAIKYERWTEIGVALGRALGSRVRDANVLDLDRTLVVPAPMPWQRRLYRGIDHTRLIADAAAAELGCCVASVLTRRHGPPQVALPPGERRRTGRRGMQVRRRVGGWPLEDLHILVVDDVRTTGATMMGAIRVLRRLKPARIAVGVLAVSDSAARRSRSSQS